MAERRMFSKRIINSARFLRMPISSQALYFHLGINADDDGVVEAYTVIKTVGCTEDDLRVLVAKGFVKVLNDDLVSYINDWTENNQIRADRKTDSIYRELLISIIPDVKLIEKKHRADVSIKTETIEQPMDNQWTSSGQPLDGIGKDSIGKDSIVQESKGKDSKGKKNQSMTDYQIEGFTENPDLIQVLKDYVKMRKAIKAPNTERAVTLFLNKLNELATTDEQKIKVVEQSIERGWKTFYPLKEQPIQDISNVPDEELSEMDRIYKKLRC